MTSEKKTRMMGKTSSYAITGLVALASLINGCRSMYVAPTKEDMQRERVFEKSRAEDCISNLKYDSAREGLEKVVQEGAHATFKYDDFGPEYSRLITRIERSNYLTKNALAGADAGVLRIYDELNKKGEKDNFYENLNENQKEKLAQISLDLDNLATEFCDENGLEYKDLINLKERARTLGNQVFIDHLIDEFKENARKLKARIELKHALLVSEGLYGIMSKELELENGIERICTGVGYSDMKNTLLKKIFSESPLEERVNHIASHIKRDKSVDGDNIVRQHRFEIVNPLWKLYSERKIDGKELMAAVYIVDSMIAEKVASTSKESGITRFGKQVLNVVIPLAPAYLAIEAGSHTGAPDRAEEFAGKKFADDTLESTLRYLHLIQLGATNGGHVVGEQSKITRKMIISVLEQAGQIAIIYGIANPEEAGKGGAGGGGGGGGGGAPGAPIDW